MNIQQLLKDAEAGDLKAQWDLSNMYYEGDGVTQDDEKAFYSRVKACCTITISQREVPFGPPGQKVCNFTSKSVYFTIKYLKLRIIVFLISLQIYNECY